MWTGGMKLSVRKFLLEQTLADIRMRGVAMGFDELEITTHDGIIRIPLGRISELAFVKKL